MLFLDALFEIKRSNINANRFPLLLLSECQWMIYNRKSYSTPPNLATLNLGNHQAAGVGNKFKALFKTGTATGSPDSIDQHVQQEKFTAFGNV